MSSAQNTAGANHAGSTRGVVAAGSPFAAQAGARILREGGNAADAAVATALALAVADPANNSLFGRCQIVVRASDGACSAIDGASQAPAGTPPRARGDGAQDAREGYRAVPVPGLPGALEKLHSAHGRIAFARVAAPAAELAEAGFGPPAHLAAVWAARAIELRANAPARAAYLVRVPVDSGRANATPDSHPDSVPVLFRHARLAALIRAFGEQGAEALTRGATARELAHAVAGAGGYWTESDLAACAARDGEVVRGRFRDCEIVTVGRQAWGHTLVQMLSMLDAMPRFGRALDGVEAERLLLTFLCALSDRPQAIGTLEPKTFGLPYETLVDRAFCERRAALVQALIDGERAPRLAPAAAAPVAAHGPAHGHGREAGPGDDPDTTHLSVIDAEGASVAMTCSIGPHFGARVADPVHGVLLAHSYRMASDPKPGARDETEMSPVIVTRNGKLLLSLGAAGSERIPGAIAQVIVNVVDRGLDLPAAIAFPRVNVKEGAIRLHEDAGEDVARALRARGYAFARSARGHLEHLGVVHACGAGDRGGWVGAADPAWDGAAAAP